MALWPQYVIAAWLFAMLIHHLYRDAKSANEKPSGFLIGDILISFVVFAAQVWILQRGGFWASLGWPA